MGWFKKKPDPISDRARHLSDQIAALEAQIKQLDTKLVRGRPGPRLRSTAVPHGAAPHAIPAQPAPAKPAEPTEPIFEEVDQNPLKDRSESTSTPDHYNEMGVRKYDLAAFIRRLKNNLRGTSTANPKLVSYLAAGSIQGLRPMRYEKRVARNRFLISALILLLVLAGIIAELVHHLR